MNKTMIQSYHEPEGLAAIRVGNECYHVNREMRAAYPQRYSRTFGFYDGIACVHDERGAHHIDPTGKSIHEQRFHWSGNFQDGACAVCDNSGFYHVDSTGKPLYMERFSYVGDYRHDVAVAHLHGKAFHIRKDGSRVHDKSFDFAEPFHKGYAVVKDADGWFHVDEQGEPIHALRLQRAEPFYNQVAFCTDTKNRKIRLYENGHYNLIPKTLGFIGHMGILHAITNGNSVVLYLRHGERFHITPETPNWGNEVELTPAGMEKVRALGSLFKGVPIDAFHSPLIRCKQTATCFTEGAGVSVQVIPDSMLGSPGIYMDGSSEHEELMLKGFHAFCNTYLQIGFQVGMRPLADASEELLEYLGYKSKPGGLSLFVSHDMQTACLMSFLGIKHPTPWDWCDYLEGVCIIQGAQGTSYHRFLGNLD